MRAARLFRPGKPHTACRFPGLLIGFLLLAGCHTPEERGVALRPAESTTIAPRPARLDRVIARLLPHFPNVACHRYGIVDSAVPNASINARGTLKVTTGLLGLAESDELLAFAVAHELAHASLRHPRRQRRNGWLQIIVTGAAMWAAHEATGSRSDAALAGAGVFISTALLGTLPAMRRMEVEADRLAADILPRAGFRPGIGAEFWRRYALARPHPQRPLWISGHPADAQRIDLLSPQPRLRSPDGMGSEPASR